MVLRVPSAVDDPSLLQDEPFKTCFQERRPAREGRNRNKNRAAFYLDVEKRMREEPGGVSCFLPRPHIIGRAEAVTVSWMQLKRG